MTTMDWQPETMPGPPAPAGTPPDPGDLHEPQTLRRWGDTVVGATVAAEEVTSGLIARLRRAAAQPGRHVAQLADRGAAERARWRRRAGDAAQAAAVTVATSPVADRVVDSQLQRVLRPVVRAVLDDVLLLLEEEPERIQSLMRGQSETVVDELVGRLRASAEAGDMVVDRLASRVFHRGPRPEPAPPPTR